MFSPHRLPYGLRPWAALLGALLRAVYVLWRAARRAAAVLFRRARARRRR